MDALDNIEICIDLLLAHLEMLKNENSRLRAEILSLNQEKTELANENQNLHSSLEREKATRRQAIIRMDVLLARIQEENSAE